VGALKTSEDAVIRRAQALDPGALAEIYERYYDGIYRYLYTRIGHQPDAEDLTEQVFLKMVDAIPRFRPRGVRFSAWLYRIAHNLLVDRYRRGGRDPVQLGDHVPDGGRHADPQAAYERVEERERLLAAIRRLTPEQQQLVALRFIDNLEVAEVAEIMNRKPGAIHAMQHRALASLGRFFKAQDLEAARFVEARRA
jgi:RNA polymerase sigma-70 factor (ECF subfamily)